MPIRFLNYRDLIAGSFFSFLGLLAAVGALRLRMGTAMRMGPGYFPFVLGGALIALGLLIAFSSLRISKKEKTDQVEPMSLRPIVLVSIGILVFANIVQIAGLALATVALVTISGVAYRGFRWVELGVLGVGLSIFAVGIFSFGLNLPIQVLPA